MNAQLRAAQKEEEREGYKDTEMKSEKERRTRRRGSTIGK
jgi:hypothetical protein